MKKPVDPRRHSWPPAEREEEDDDSDETIVIPAKMICSVGDKAEPSKHEGVRHCSSISSTSTCLVPSISNWSLDCSETPEYFLENLMLIGESGVGKSSLIRRFEKQNFQPELTATVGIDIVSKTVLIDGKAVKLGIQDTAGQERFRAIARSFIQKCQGALVVYDITCRKTFENAKYWLQLVNKESSTPNLPVVILVGNKSDLVDTRAVSTDQGMELAKEYDIKFVEVSSKLDMHGKVERLFMTLACDAYLKGNYKIRPNTVRLSHTEKKSSCCSS